MRSEFDPFPSRDSSIQPSVTPPFALNEENQPLALRIRPAALSVRVHHVSSQSDFPGARSRNR
jgi:hypothetical protein